LGSIVAGITTRTIKDTFVINFCKRGCIKYIGNFGRAVDPIIIGKAKISFPP
jgi:hypothetical protein